MSFKSTGEVRPVRHEFAIWHRPPASRTVEHDLGAPSTTFEARSESHQTPFGSILPSKAKLIGRCQIRATMRRSGILQERFQRL